MHMLGLFIVSWHKRIIVNTDENGEERRSRILLYVNFNSLTPKSWVSLPQNADTLLDSKGSILGWAKAVCSS